MTKINEKQRTQLIDLENLGRIMPQNIQAEEAVLGALMLERNTWHQISDILMAECFYKESHKYIFEAVKTICEQKKDCDLLSLAQELRKSRKLEAVGGSYYLATLTNNVVSSANIQHHARLIFEQYIKRKLIEFSYNLTKDAYSEQTDALELLSDYGEKLPNLIQIAPAEISTIKDGLREVLRNTIKNQKNEELSGLKTGFAYFDKRAGGFQPSDLVIIAGEASMGKTSLALNIARNMAVENPIAIYSLEMSMLQLSSRFTAMESRVSGSSILYKKLSDSELQSVEHGIGKIENLPIYMDERINSNIENIIASIRYMVLKFGIKAAFIDYLGLMSTKAKYGTKEQMTGDMAKMLKNLAKELNICIVALSQLSRVSAGSDPYPTLARLRDSGQIEQHADVVIFPYRPEYFKKNLKYKKPYDHISTENTAIFDVAKGRNIGVFGFIVGFDCATTKFYNFHENEMPISEINEENEEEPF